MLMQLKAAQNAENWQQKAARAAAIAGKSAAVHDRDDTFITEGFEALKEARMFSALVPEDLGGGGATIAEMCDAIRLIGRSCSSTALGFSMHSHQVAIAGWRLRHQKAPTEALLKRIAAEELILVSSGGSD